MKHLRTLSILIAALWGYTVAHAEKVEIDGIWYNLISKAKLAEVTFKGDTYDSDKYEYYGDITIPATVTYNGAQYSVTSIGSSAFAVCSRLTSITIPGSVTSIGESAFFRCSSLTSITIPESVSTIGMGAFNYCDELTAVHISSIDAWCNISFGRNDSNPLYSADKLYLNGELVTELDIPEGVISIGAYAFSGCSSLTSITIPESVTTIGNAAFYRCENLTSITISESVTSIGNSAFSDCSSLTTITIPESVTSIEGSAFSGCSSLTYITIPESVTSIGNSAFSDCSSLTTITIPESVTSIEGWAFSGCSSLTSITIPESVTSIGGHAFYNCSSLTYITIPNGVFSIESYAFYGCSSLATIVLPKSVGYIGYEVFVNCSDLTDVYCYAESVPETTAGVFNGSYPEYATLHVPANALESYRAISPWNNFGSFMELDADITSITLSESSATLTMEETLALTIITTPENADKNLFSWNSSNPSVATVDNAGIILAIARGTTTVTVTANDGSGLSASCEVIVVGNVVKIDGVWYNLDQGSKQGKVISSEDTKYSGSLTIPAIVTYDGVEYSVTRIGRFAFKGCSSLGGVTIPESVTSIGEGAFYGCSELSITCYADTPPIADGPIFENDNFVQEFVPIQSESAYYAAEYWKDAWIIAGFVLPGTCGANLTWSLSDDGELIIEGTGYMYNFREDEYTWGAYVAPWRNSLVKVKNVIIEEGVTSIGSYAFYYCTNLTSITIPESVTSIGESAFFGCSSLTSITCQAVIPPTIDEYGVFGGVDKSIPVYVPAGSVVHYNATNGWNEFTNIQPFTMNVSTITLNQSFSILLEGDSITLTAIILPDEASDNPVTWSSSNSNVATVDNMGKVTAVAPGTATITVTANDGSGVSASCEVTVKEKLLGKCDVPMVNYTEGKVVLTCSTEEVEYVTSVVPDNELNYQAHEFDFIPTYTFNVYAAKAKYENSDVVSVTICWIDCAEDHEDSETTDILTIPSQPVLIQSANGVITFTGLVEGTTVMVYNLEGKFVEAADATNGTASIVTGLEVGSTAIVKIGERSVKVVIK